MEISQLDARRIIATVGSSGQPPVWGAGCFTDGFEPTLGLLEEEFLADYLKQGGAAFKLVVGHYGGGKTHFLYLLREMGWRQGYVVAYVPLTPEETPFHRLDLVYRAIATGLTYPPETRDPATGILPLLKLAVSRWRQGPSGSDQEVVKNLALDSTRDLESMNYTRALSGALQAVQDGDEETAQNLVMWLSGQGYDRAIHGESGILAPIDRSTALTSLRCLARWIRQAGFAGLVVLFDEAERMPSMSGRQKELMLSNLRELIDETARGTLPGTFVAYAVPDFRFFDGKTGVYEAVKQRISTMFDFYNPSGVSIGLERLVEELEPHLVSIGTKLWQLYELAYGIKLDRDLADKAVHVVAAAVGAARFADVSYRRLFVQSIVRAFEQLRRAPGIRIDQAWADQVVDQFVGGTPPGGGG
jgi:hypothetical protein